MAALLKIDKSALIKKIQDNRHLNFIYLKRHLIPEDAQRILKKKITGVYGLDEFRRYYPAAAITAQLIGMTNIDDQGQSVLELTMHNFNGINCCSFSRIFFPADKAPFIFHQADYVLYRQDNRVSSFLLLVFAL